MIAHIETARTTKFTPDSVIGFMLGLPFATPRPPWYLFGFVCLTILAPRIFSDVRKTRLTYLVAVMSCACFTAMSTLVSPDSADISTSAAFGSSIVFCFFLFGFGVQNILHLLRGYCCAMSMIAIAVWIAFCGTGKWVYGIELFVYPNLRMWGSDLFPDWPNFLCFGLTLSFLLNSLVHKNFSHAALNLGAAVLTTSRLSIVGIVLGIGYLAMHVGMRRRMFPILFGAVLLIAGVMAIRTDAMENADQIFQRLQKTQDREIVYEHLWRRFIDRPILGWGAVSARGGDTEMAFQDDSVMSFHSSYLEILVRGGILSFIPYLYVIFPGNLWQYRRGPYTWLILLFLLCATVQNILKHPHYVMMFSALLVHRRQLAEILVGENATAETTKQLRSQVVRPASRIPVLLSGERQ